MNPERFRISSISHLTIVFLGCVLMIVSGCKEKYIVGIVPVYTEESRNDEAFTITERLDMEEGYGEAVRESRKYNRTVYPLYLKCEKRSYGYVDCSHALTAHEGWAENVRKFYADYYFEKKKDIQGFMRMNGINLLVMSTYVKNRKKDTYDIQLVVFRFVLGSDDSLTARKDAFSVKGLDDYKRLRLMSKESLMRIMDKIEKSNPD